MALQPAADIAKIGVSGFADRVEDFERRRRRLARGLPGGELDELGDERLSALDRPAWPFPGPAAAERLGEAAVPLPVGKRRPGDEAEPFQQRRIGQPHRLRLVIAEHAKYRGDNAFAGALVEVAPRERVAARDRFYPGGVGPQILDLRSERDPRWRHDGCHIRRRLVRAPAAAFRCDRAFA